MVLVQECDGKAKVASVGSLAHDFTKPGRAGLAIRAAAAEFDGMAVVHGWEDFFDEPYHGWEVASGQWHIRESLLAGQGKLVKGAPWGSELVIRTTLKGKAEEVPVLNGALRADRSA